MNCRETILNGEIFTYCQEQTAPFADRLQAIFQRRVVGELTGAAVRAQVTVATETVELKPRVTQDGIAGLVANSFGRFPELLANTVAVSMRTSANRYLARRFTRNLGPFATPLGSPRDYPDFFAPADLGVIALHREPSQIKGR